MRRLLIVSLALIAFASSIAAQSKHPFTFDDMMRYHGVHSPAGVAMAFMVMQRAFAVLSPGEPPERRSITVRTACSMALAALFWPNE